MKATRSLTRAARLSTVADTTQVHLSLSSNSVHAARSEFDLSYCRSRRDQVWSRVVSKPQTFEEAGFRHQRKTILIRVKMTTVHVNDRIKLLFMQPRGGSMHQAAATYWNQIAEQQPLVTDWAKQMFPLPQDMMDMALDCEERRLVNEGADFQVSAAYLKFMPLLWERKAISKFLLDNPSLRVAIPPMETLSEALYTASKDFSLNKFQLKELSDLLKVKPT